MSNQTVLPTTMEEIECALEIICKATMIDNVRGKLTVECDGGYPRLIYTEIGKRLSKPTEIKRKP